MTTIGTATLQIIPSLAGVSDSVNKQLGGALDGKKFGKAFGKDIAAGVKASESDVKRATDAYAKLYDKQKDALGKVAAEQAKLNDLQTKGVTGGRLVAQSERLETAKRNEARALREARDAYKEYETAADRAANAGKGGGGLLDKFKGLAGGAKSGGAEAATGFVEGFGGPIAALGTKAGPIGLALAAAAALGLAAGGLIGRQVFAGMEQEQQRANVAAQLGLDPAAMKPIADASAKAYASNFGESVAANMDAARVAIQTGLIGPDSGSSATEQMVEQLTTVSSILGEDIPSTARAAQQAIRTGLAPDATAAFDLIVKGVQSGLNVSGDFLDSLDEYGTQFRKLGLSGPEAFGLISQGLKGGARDTDVVADAIKEFSVQVVPGVKPAAAALTDLGFNVDDTLAKFAQGGPVAKQAFADVLTALNNVQDPVRKNTDGLGLFATKWEDLGAAAGKLDLSTAVQQLGLVQGATQKAADTMGNTATGSVETAKRAFETGADSMQQSLAEAFGPLLKEGADFLVAHKDEIADAFTWMAGAATEFGSAVGAAVGGVIKVTGLLVGAIGDTVGFVLDGFESLVGGAATVADAVGLDGLAGDLRNGQEQLGVWSDQFHGWGEGLNRFGDSVLNTSINLHNFDNSLASTQQSAQNAAAQVQHVKEQMAALPGGKQIDITAIVTYKDQNGLVIGPDQLKTPAFIPAVPGETRPPPGGGRAFGGPISGAGGPRSDSIPIWASHGEHMLPADEVDMMGGQAGVYQFRSMLRAGLFAGGGALDNLKLGALIWPPEPVGPSDKTRPGGVPDLDPGKSPNQIGLPDWSTPGQTFGPPPPGWWDKPINPDDVLFPDYQPPWIRDWQKKHGKRIKPLGFAGGGAIGPDVQAAGELVGTPYSQANRTDCSGMVARVIDRTLGLPEAGLMSTKNAADWLAAHGFKKGIGGPGMISVGWYDHGPNPNDGHMAMTLSDGSNAEAGGGVGDIFQIGGGAAGASDPQFDQHMFLPTVYGEGPAGSSSASPFAGGSAVAAMIGGAAATPTGVSGGGTSSSGGGGGSSFSLPSSIGGLAAFGLNDLGKGIGTTKSGSDLSLFGEAAGAAVSGQVDSALGVLGVSGSPGWLKAISTLVGGISIGGGGSAAPLSATSTGMGTPPPDDAGNMHGSRAGQQPGPVYNITARDTEDAFIKAQRIEREKAAAKLSRF